MCEPWFCVGLGWLPILVGIMLSSSMVIPYCIAVGLGHVPAGFPYISDTGTEPPESCVFGQLLNITAALSFAVFYVRYKQVTETNEDIPKLHFLNKIALIIGAAAALGMSLVANFQETNVITVHIIGAFMCFVSGVLYGFIHSWISYQMHPNHSSLFVCNVRLVLSSLGLVFLIMTSMFTSLSMSKHGGKDILDWSPGDDGFALHIVATSSEWCMGLAFVAFFFTFIREFQKLAIVAEIKSSTQYMSIPGDDVSGLLT